MIEEMVEKKDILKKKIDGINQCLNDFLKASKTKIDDLRAENDRFFI
jgi:hypothetical protein